jgi:hypothetical protein
MTLIWWIIDFPFSKNKTSAKIKEISQKIFKNMTLCWEL